MNDIDDPLWNPAAKADGDLVRIEQLLSPLGARARGITMPTVRTHQPRHLRGLGWAMAAAVTLMVSAGAFQYRLRWQEGAGWQASRTTAASTTNSRLDPGHRIVTRPDQTARISVARIGNISLSPDSSLRLERTGTGQHRVRLDSGHMRARIWAPPGYFGVETGSAEIVDLGCDFEVWKQADGTGRVQVLSGWISYRAGDNDILVAEGYAASFDRTRIGTPVRVDAPTAFAQAVHALDAQSDDNTANVEALAATVAKAARNQDSLTLLSLLTRRPLLARTDIYPRLAEALRVRNDAPGHRKAWEDGDTSAMNAWWERLPRQPKRWLANWNDVLPWWSADIGLEHTLAGCPLSTRVSADAPALQDPMQCHAASNQRGPLQRTFRCCVSSRLQPVAAIKHADHAQ